MAALYEDISGSRYLSSSISSLSASRQQSSQIAKAYRQAAQLFLTRRLPEALSTIEPIISAPPSENADDHVPGYAPVATASRGTRVKVWSFYLTFLNSVVELGAEEGKHAFGSARWKALVSKCRDGSVWDDVVRDGYAGVEGDVDADVVVNLYTLYPLLSGGSVANASAGAPSSSPTRPRSASTSPSSRRTSPPPPTPPSTSPRTSPRPRTPAASLPPTAPTPRATSTPASSCSSCTPCTCSRATTSGTTPASSSA